MQRPVDGIIGTGLLVALVLLVAGPSGLAQENIRIEESPWLISLWIGKFVWTRDPERGHIQGVTFKDINAVADPLRVELTGFDESHAVSDVAFQGVRVNGRPLTQADVKMNAFVRNVSVNP